LYDKWHEVNFVTYLTVAISYEQVMSLPLPKSKMPQIQQESLANVREARDSLGI